MRTRMARWGQQLAKPSVPALPQPPSCWRGCSLSPGQPALVSRAACLLRRRRTGWQGAACVLSSAQGARRHRAGTPLLLAGGSPGCEWLPRQPRDRCHVHQRCAARCGPAGWLACSQQHIFLRRPAAPSGTLLPIQSIATAVPLPPLCLLPDDLKVAHIEVAPEGEAAPVLCQRACRPRLDQAAAQFGPPAADAAHWPPLCAGFDAQFSSLGKEYHYLLSSGLPNPLHVSCWWVQGWRADRKRQIPRTAQGVAVRGLSGHAQRPHTHACRPSSAGGCTTGGASAAGASHPGWQTLAWTWQRCRRQLRCCWERTTSPHSWM